MAQQALRVARSRNENRAIWREQKIAEAEEIVIFDFLTDIHPDGEKGASKRYRVDAHSCRMSSLVITEVYGQLLCVGMPKAEFSIAWFHINARSASHGRIAPLGKERNDKK